MTLQKMALLTALAMVGVALVINIVSLATDYWASSSVVHFGLWKLCVLSVCSDFEPQDWVKGVRASMFLAFISDLGAIGALLLLFGVKAVPQNVAKIGAIVMTCLACLLNIIAISVAASKISSGLSWSWGVGIGSTLLEIGATLFTCITKRDD